MKKLLIVGAGGIGSWLAENLFYSVKTKQLKINIYIADNDTVDTKNLTYQNFVEKDLLDNKAEVIANRFSFQDIQTKIEKHTQLEGYDCIISCVDNTIFRSLLFNYAIKNPKVYWIDLRSESRTIAFYTKQPTDTLEYLLSTLPKDIVESSSCQLQFELDAGISQRGNKIIAAIGEQLVLNWARGDKNLAKYTHIF